MASQSHAIPEERVASVRLTLAVYEQLQSIAQSEHRTVSQELRRLVEKHVESERELRDAA
jgi:predicted DNA-binding protein